MHPPARLRAPATPPMLEPRLHSLSLAQYASVLAGLAEGHELARVLAHERVEPARWPGAEEAWSDQIAEAAAGEGEALQAAFDQHLAAGQERYGRRLPPVDEDLQAFLDFRGRWMQDADPPALLERLGLRLAEVARLCRRWSQRLAADPVLAARAQEILRDEPGELPTVAPVAIELPPASAGATPAPPELNEDEPLDDEPTEIDDVPLFAPLPRWERPKTGAAEDVRVDVPLAAAGPAASKHAVAPKAVAKPTFLKTGAFPVLGERPVALFSAGATSPQEPPHAPTAVAPTVELSTFSVAPALPFSDGPHASAPSRDDAGGAGGHTAPLPTVLPDARLPFAPVELHEAAHQAPAGRAVADARSSPSGTASLQGIPLAAVLPFVPPGEIEGPSPLEEHDTAPLDRTAVMPILVESALPPLRAAKDEPSLTQPPGELSLGRYAAFCAELEAFPDAAPETFGRYGLASAREGVKLASAWQARFRKSPSEYNEWQRLYRAFVEQCRTKERPEVPS